jgi:hypothetical protein
MGCSFQTCSGSKRAPDATQSLRDSLCFTVIPSHTTMDEFVCDYPVQLLTSRLVVESEDIESFWFVSIRRRRPHTRP